MSIMCNMIDQCTAPKGLCVHEKMMMAIGAVDPTLCLNSNFLIIKWQNSRTLDNDKSLACRLIVGIAYANQNDLLH